MIKNVEDLRSRLQTAMQIENTTIPPYLCALWSIVPGTNEAAAEAILDVVMEEMLHLTLVANVLNAVTDAQGHGPDLYRADFLPRQWPANLPHSDDSFLVGLGPLSPDSLDTFRHIEWPAAIGAPPQESRYHTIAQFYEAILEALERLAGQGNIFTGDPAWQIGPDRYYYGGGGEVVAVHDLESAIEALEVVVFEGEGIDLSVYDGDHEFFDEPRELAHFFRFDELYRGRRYRNDDTFSSGPSGDWLYLDFDAVLPMRRNPRAEDYPQGSELREMTDACSRTYTSLLAQLHEAFTGRPEALIGAVVTMKQLEGEAVALMRVPCGDGVHTAGPAFQWRPPLDAP